MSQTQCGDITVELCRAPVQIGILVEGQHMSGAFIANRLRRGICISDGAREIAVTVDDALLLLSWLEEQAPALQAMLDEEAAALAAVESRVSTANAGPAPKPSQAEGDEETIDEALREKGA